ncbi:hypothetical protein [Paracoccus xiamenensis]|uniref:hypothetical protein n=1 Tax=Paracoccus xiamenensis TaxID=2714901 RepID=UPI00140E80EA|nr:hypothetical protein [Paracoccus xiamenensis]NHF74209.1 hypothetical protein [Paracoccus xiamenensis]
MASSHSFTVSYDRRIVRDAIRAFVLHRCFREQKGLWLAECGLLLFLGWRFAGGRHGWPELVLLVLVLLPRSSSR